MSRLPLIPEKAQSLFSGHVADDAHLYQAALAADRVVITQDSHQIERRDEIRRRVGVEVFDLAEVIAQDPHA